MKLITEYLTFQSRGNTDIINLNEPLTKTLGNSKLSEGQITVFGIGSTTGITTLEYEPGLVATDMAEMYNTFAPYQKRYEHNKTWGDDNGAAHLRSAITGTSVTIPFLEGKLILGTWQQVVFIDFDTRPRSRKIVVQLIGI